MDRIEHAAKLHREGAFEQAQDIYCSLLKANPSDFNAKHMLGVLHCQRGQLDEGKALISAALQLRPQSVEALINLAHAHQLADDRNSAVEQYNKALTIEPEAAAARMGLAHCLHATGQFVAALSIYSTMVSTHPRSCEVWNNRGITLASLGQFRDAIQSYGEALILNPRYAFALNNRGLSHLHVCQPDRALDDFDTALGIRSAYPEAWHNRGLALSKLGRSQQAADSFERALAIRPHYREAITNLAVLLSGMGQVERAVELIGDLLKRDPSDAAALNHFGALMAQLNRYDDAIGYFDQSIGLRPNFDDPLNNKGISLAHLGRHADALASYDTAIADNPDHAEAWHNKGISLRKLNRLADAATAFERAHQLKPAHKFALGEQLSCELASCHWDRVRVLTSRIKSDPNACIAPFTTLALDLTAAEQLTLARRYSGAIGMESISKPARIKSASPKIRIAYLSADFHEHATAYLIAELIEQHDRRLFDVVGISWGPNDNGPMRKRLQAAFDEFHDVQGMSDRAVADLIARSQTDIIVDLKGHTTDARPGILALRPAPLQVSYLGYPGTLGVELNDYIIADSIVLPLDQQPHYSEAILHMPHCYQCNDSTRRFAVDTPTRAQVGLPEDGFVFCCFNNSYKITEPVFDDWMTILGSVERSVLWLLAANAEAMTSLRDAARHRGIDPNRLLFAPRMRLEYHLARHRLADLFLDTTPYNAHTTASDALWADVPVLTVLGRTFAGRVSASLLTALQLPELIATSASDYRGKALSFAQDPVALASCKDRLCAARGRSTLFDGKAFARDFENQMKRLLHTHAMHSAA